MTAVWVISSAGGCESDDASPPSSPAESAPASGDTDGPPEALRRFKDEATLGDLLELLAMPHQLARSGSLGPHTISYRAHFELLPQAPDDHPPKVGEAIHTSFDVDDELELRWDLPADGVPRAWLRQQNSREDRRELILLDGQAYTRLHEDQWYQRELDGDLHETWFAEAYASVHDFVEFAAPQLTLERVDELDGGPSGKQLEVHLSLGKGRDEALGRDGAPSRWRATSRIDAASGWVRIDAESGVWLAAEMNLAWRMTDAAQRPLVGKSSINASLAPGPVQIELPAGAVPMPERMRYTVERNKLLDGLAAP